MKEEKRKSFCGFLWFWLPCHLLSLLAKTKQDVALSNQLGRFCWASLLSPDRANRRIKPGCYTLLIWLIRFTFSGSFKCFCELSHRMFWKRWNPLKYQLIWWHLEIAVASFIMRTKPIINALIPFVNFIFVFLSLKSGIGKQRTSDYFLF